VNDAFGRPQSVVVLGGTSDIAGAVLDRLVAAGTRRVVLAGRDPEGLEKAADRLRQAGADPVATVDFDARELDQAGAAVESCWAALDGADADLVLVAVGVLGDQGHDERRPEAVAGRMEDQGRGRIVVLSSVAGVRVRRANYVYGSAKAGLDAYAVGLGESLRDRGVVVQVVRPGFVRTKMTEGRPAAPFAVDAGAVADAVVAGLAGDRPVVWVPPVLRWVFGIFRLLPQALWRRLPG
jgi:decaprenylphospho-beta-D-erythro-pentofuranosid-2-ulose 2-reductase